MSDLKGGGQRRDEPADLSGRVREGVRAAFARMSTGTKLLLLLTLALLPLGLIAIFASIDSARTTREARTAAVQLIAAQSGQTLTTTLVRSTAALRAAATALTLNSAGRGACRRTISQFDNSVRWGRFAIFGPDRRLICASPGFEPDAPDAGTAVDHFTAHITEDGQALRLSVRTIQGGALVVSEFPRDAIVAMTRPVRAPSAYEVSIIEGPRRMLVARVGSGGTLDDLEVATAPAFSGQMTIALAVSVAPIRAIEVLLMVLPILMWAFALVIGWLVVNGFVLRPLGQLQRAVATYRPGDTAMPSSATWTPAVEIRRLADAISQLGTTVARHEAELEAGLARQTRLTREVHHRVKNNLQVVASLIHLHARGVISDETEEAYKSILRRVDALAIVHRNHYAELEESRGVAVRSLLGELAANLRATAGPKHNRMSIHLEIDSAHANQDNAVAIAFLFTEAAELAMLCNPAAAITVRLREVAPDRALLSISSPALRPSEQLHDYLADRFGRVFEGLSRQLRSKLQRDEAEGMFGVEVAILP